MSKFCVNCINYTVMGLGEYCTRRITVSDEINLVNGEDLKTLKSGKYTICEKERDSSFFNMRCGKSGKFYVYGPGRISGIDLAKSQIRFKVLL